MSITSDKESVSRMYESNEVLAGEIISDGWLHYGYFDKSNADATLAEGSERFTRIMIEKTPIATGEMFCDIGCGVGTPGIMLARQKHCRVDGVTISSHQQQAATQKAKEAGLDQLASFYLADAHALPFEDSSYDGAWFFESISHMDHEKALLEAKRILKPGAILLIADFILLKTATSDFKMMAREKVHSFFIDLDEYQQILARCGFEILELNDVTPFVGNTFPQKFKEAFSQNRERITHLLGSETITKWLDIHEAISRNTGYRTISAKAS